MKALLLSSIVGFFISSAVQASGLYIPPPPHIKINKNTKKVDVMKEKTMKDEKKESKKEDKK